MKTAYPQGDVVHFIDQPHNISKWMQAMQNVYSIANQPGYDTSLAFNQVTQSWENMERRDFKNWMSFYEENAHQKYKTAKNIKTADPYYQGPPGVMIPMDHLKATLPMGNQSPDMSEFEIPTDPVLEKAQKAEEVKKKIKGIVGRLNAAERLATSDPDVIRELQNRIDIGIANWLKALQDVKRAVQLAPMRNAASPILEDIIVKQANIFKSKGFVKAAAEMYKLSQAPVDPMLQQAPLESEEGGESALDEFVDGMSLGGDENEAEDELVVEEDELDVDEPITVVAQALPGNFDTNQFDPNQADPDRPETDINVEEPEVLPEEVPQVEEVSKEFAETKMHEKTDNLLDAALANVTLPDVINRLEILANLFRTREIPRQLAIVDLMMDRLNISAFFPNLAEATSKSLDSNQYALTRCEDVLSKLRGAVKTPAINEIDLTGQEQPSEPLPANINNESVIHNLQNKTKEDKARKENRKNEQDAMEIGQPQPVTNVQEELAQPMPQPQPLQQQV